MADIPQPSREPYATGERVKIYVGPDDEDARFHGAVCEVVEVHEDDLDAETGRPTDAYSYSLKDVNSDEVLPISFRHHELVSADEGWTGYQAITAAWEGIPLDCSEIVDADLLP